MTAELPRYNYRGITIRSSGRLGRYRPYEYSFIVIILVNGGWRKLPTARAGSIRLGYEKYNEGAIM